MSVLGAPVGPTQKWTAVVLTFAMAAVVGSALGFEHIGGYLPCKLCLDQRQPYYIGVPLMALAAVSAGMRWPALLTRGLLLLGGLLMTVGLVLSVYHAGVEWGWWPGPTDCSGLAVSPSTGSGGVLDSLNTIIPPSCDKAALRIVGLSLAGWNAIASLVLAIVAYRGAFAPR